MYQSKISNIIIRLKKAKNNSPEMTIQKISDSTGVSMSTVTRIFADGSENQSFRYDSLKPIAMLLLGSDGLDEELDLDEIQMQIAEMKEKYEKKLERERDQHRRSVDFLMHQIELKDDRITLLLNALEDRSEQFKRLHDQYTDVMSQLLENKGIITKVLEKEEEREMKERDKFTWEQGDVIITPPIEDSEDRFDSPIGIKDVVMPKKEQKK